MDKFLKKIKLIETFSISLDVSKNKFISELSKVTEKNELSFFTDLYDMFDIFFSRNKKYKGVITTSGFKIRQKIKVANNTYPSAQGKFIEKNNKLVFETTITGLNNFFYFFYSIGILIFIRILFDSDFLEKNQPEIIFISLFIIIILISPYFVIREKIKKMKSELQREFFNLTK